MAENSCHKLSMNEDVLSAFHNAAINPLGLVFSKITSANIGYNFGILIQLPSKLQKQDIIDC
jgi:hypothetical protein